MQEIKDEVRSIKHALLSDLRKECGGIVFRQAINHLIEPMRPISNIRTL